MKNSAEPETRRGGEFVSAVQNWTMVLMALIFIALYAAVLFGGFNHLSDDRMIAHLEPIIFVVIGYFFGRVPARFCERILKDEIARQIRRSDAAQQAKEQCQQAREALDEKIRNARATLAPSAIEASSARRTPLAGSLTIPGGAVPDDALRQALAFVIKILDS